MAPSLPRLSDITSEQVECVAAYHAHQREVEAWMRELGANISSATEWKKSIPKVLQNMKMAKKKRYKTVPTYIRTNLEKMIEKRKRAGELERLKPHNERDSNTEKGHEGFRRILELALKTWFTENSTASSNKSQHSKARDGSPDVAGTAHNLGKVALQPTISAQDARPEDETLELDYEVPDTENGEESPDIEDVPIDFDEERFRNKENLLHIIAQTISGLMCLEELGKDLANAKLPVAAYSAACSVLYCQIRKLCRDRALPTGTSLDNTFAQFYESKPAFADDRIWSRTSYMEILNIVAGWSKSKLRFRVLNQDESRDGRVTLLETIAEQVYLEIDCAQFGRSDGLYSDFAEDFMDTFPGPGHEPKPCPFYLMVGVAIQHVFLRSFDNKLHSEVSTASLLVRDAKLITQRFFGRIPKQDEWKSPEAYSKILSHFPKRGISPAKDPMEHFDIRSVDQVGLSVLSAGLLYLRYSCTEMSFGMFHSLNAGEDGRLLDFVCALKALMIQSNRPQWTDDTRANYILDTICELIFAGPAPGTINDLEDRWNALRTEEWTESAISKKLVQPSFCIGTALFSTGFILTKKHKANLSKMLGRDKLRTLMQQMRAVVDAYGQQRKLALAWTDIAAISHVEYKDMLAELSNQGLRRRPIFEEVGGRMKIRECYDLSTVTSVFRQAGQSFVDNLNAHALNKKNLGFPYIPNPRVWMLDVEADIVPEPVSEPGEYLQYLQGRSNQSMPMPTLKIHHLSAHDPNAEFSESEQQKQQSEDVILDRLSKRMAYRILSKWELTDGGDYVRLGTVSGMEEQTGCLF